MCIEQEHLTLSAAAHAAYAFCVESPIARVFILRHLVSGFVSVVDRQTYTASRGTMKYSACSIIFAGGSAELIQLADAVPPQLFGSSEPAANPKPTNKHEDY